MLAKNVSALIMCGMAWVNSVYAITIINEDRDNKSFEVKVYAFSDPNINCDNIDEKYLIFQTGEKYHPFPKGSKFSTGFSTNPLVKYLCFKTWYDKRWYGDSETVLNNDQCVVRLETACPYDFWYGNKYDKGKRGTPGGTTHEGVSVPKNLYCYPGRDQQAQGTDCPK